MATDLDIGFLLSSEGRVSVAGYDQLLFSGGRFCANRAKWVSVVDHSHLSARLVGSLTRCASRMSSKRNPRDGLARERPASTSAAMACSVESVEVDRAVSDRSPH